MADDEAETKRHAHKAAQHEIDAAAAASLANEHERAAQLALVETQKHEREESRIRAACRQCDQTHKLGIRTTTS